MKIKSKKLMATLGLAVISSTILTGCINIDFSDNQPLTSQQTSQKNNWEKTLKQLTSQKQSLTEKLWTLNNTKTIALNQSNLRKLSQIKTSLFQTQAKLDTATNKMATLNKVLRKKYHHAVLDNGQIINTWTLLKTSGTNYHYHRAHVLAGRLKKFKTQQDKINETLWDDQNRITIALNHNDKTALNNIKAKYFKDRLKALPIINQIDMLTAQIAKFTQHLQESSANIGSQNTFDDWVLIQTMANNNQSLNRSITPNNPNDGDNTPTHSTDEENGEESEHLTTSDEPSSSHTGTTESDTGGHASTEGHAGGETGGEAGGGEAGGGAHGE